MKPIKDIFTNSVNVGNKERIISGCIGVGLIAMGIRDIKKPTAKTWIELITGGLLVLSSATGYSPLNAVLGRNTAEHVEETFESLAE